MSSTTIQADLSVPGVGWSNSTTIYPKTLPGLVDQYSKHRRYIQTATSWTRIGASSAFAAKHFDSGSGDCLLSENQEKESKTIRCLISQLCEKFYNYGWATGTGGGVSIRTGGPSQNRPWRVFVAPSGIQKEDMIGDDVFELDMEQNIVAHPKTPGLKLSACTPLWYVVYKNRPTARSVIHTHSMNAQLATLLDPTEKSEVLRVTHLEMLKGVGGHAYDCGLEIPIIDNRPSEDLLSTQLERIINKYPRSNAVLVRRHGIYVWGDSWEQAKTQCESFDYLFECCIRMRSMGIDFSAKPKSGTYREEVGIGEKRKQEEINGEGKNKRLKVNGFNGVKGINNEQDFIMTPKSIPLLPRHSKVLLLDIEGCTTAISFVKDVLFPYVLANLNTYVDSLSTFEVEQVFESLASDVKIIKSEETRSQCNEWINETCEKKLSIKEIVKTLVKNDIKATGLKSLQGKMWKSGYASGELKGHVYPDFKPLLDWCSSNSIKVSIYSSGSIAAQKLLFSKSIEGDLTPLLTNYFDTTSGGKKDAKSYKTIAKDLQVAPEEICFVSDAEGELVAAREAAIGNVVMSIREGNAELTDVGRGFPCVFSLLQLCGV